MVRERMISRALFLFVFVDKKTKHCCFETVKGNSVWKKKNILKKKNEIWQTQSLTRW